MRVRTLIVVMIVAGLVGMLPGGVAHAGGNWFDIRRDDGRGPWETWSGPFLPGAAVELQTSLYLQSEREQDRFRASAPYYAWIAPERGRSGGDRLPDGSVRLSAFDIRWTSAQSVVVHTSFVMPSLPPGQYTIEVCDEPCTELGFGFWVQGWTSVVGSVEALHLSRQRERLEGKLWKARQDVERASRGSEKLEANLEDSERVRAALTARVAVLADELAAARRSAQTTTPIPGRPFVDAWLGALVAFAILSLAIASVRRRRASRVVVPDTPEELFEPDERQRRTAAR